MVDDHILPLLPDGVNNVEFPVDSFEESHFVCVDLANLEARDLAPRARRVVAVLQILGREDECSKKHATTTLQRTKRGIFRLRHGEVMLWQVGFDEDQVVQSDLQSRVASTRSAKSLLDEGAEGKHSTSRSSLAAALGLRELPDDLNHLSGRILKGSAEEPGSWTMYILTDEAIDKVDLSVGLSY